MASNSVLSLEEAPGPDHGRYPGDEEKVNDKKALPEDVFGDEENAEIKYKVLSWWYVPSVYPVYTTTNAP